MTKSVLVTLADERCIDAAKQLFSSAYHNAGWRGDYLLLSHEVPENRLGWFRHRRILIQGCNRHFDTPVGGMAPVLASKINLFGAGFRRWERVLYVDADSIIRASLHRLVDLQGIHGVVDRNPYFDLQIATLREAASRAVSRETYQRLVTSLRERCQSHDPVFCGGLLAFSPNLINESDERRFHNLLCEYGPISRFGDQLALNLLFHRRWTPLSPVFNMILYKGQPLWPLNPACADAMIVHFSGPVKPWHRPNEHYEEWQAGLSRADEMDLSNIPEGTAWTDSFFADQTRYHESRLRVGYFLKRLPGSRAAARWFVRLN